MAATLQLGRERILRYLALRAVGQSMAGARRGTSRRPTSALTVKRLYRENGEVRLGLENGDHGEPLLPTVDARVQGRVVHVVHLAEKKPPGVGLKVSQLLNLATGALSYLLFAGTGGFVGYFFAKKRTEHEVGYQRRVEVVERIQHLVVSLAEGFETALEYIREPGPAGDLPAKEIERSIDELERHYLQQEIWLDPQTLARLDALAAESRRCHRELERLPRRYGDPNFEREYERVGAELDWWLHTDLAKAREGLTASVRATLGVGRWPYGLLR